MRSRGDLLAVIVLGLVPLAWYGLPAMTGHPLLPGDDFLQNFPLRVLVGQQLRHGNLPVYNPYIWSGAPLLAGWNAGALYPFTFLFAVLPAALAWTVNEVVVYWAAALGLYAFLRTVGRRPLSSALGAASFGFAGAMDVHLVHFGLVAGTSWVPLILLSMVKLTRPQTWARRLRWSAVLGIAGALVVLAGEPRAIDTVVIVSTMFFLWTALRGARPVAPFLAAVGIGLSVAVLLSAVQWLPGAMAVSTSQRAANTYALYGSGSLPWRWLALAFVPGVLGGSHSFGTAGWIAGYNLPEVMSYVGLLPVVAAFALLGTVRRGRGRGLPDWLIWHMVAIVGVILALGSFTPLGHVLVHVPFFGGQRLQSRNIALTDLALAVLLSYWVDHVLDRRVSEGGRSARTKRFGWVEVAALVPVLATAALAATAAIDPVAVARFAGVDAKHATEAVAQRPVLLVSLVLAVILALLVVRSGRTSPASLARFFVVFCVADLIFFNISSVWTVAPGLGNRPTAPVRAFAPGTSPVPLRLTGPIGTSGRFVIDDQASEGESILHRLGQPDLNLFHQTFSAQGYSSIVDGPYAAATGSHAATGRGTNALLPVALVNGVFDALDTTTLVTLPRDLVVPSSSPGVTHTGTRVVAAGGQARWIFGEQIDISSVSLPWTADSPGAPPTSTIRVALERSGGRLAWQNPTVVTPPTVTFWSDSPVRHPESVWWWRTPRLGPSGRRWSGRRRATRIPPPAISKTHCPLPIGRSTVTRAHSPSIRMSKLDRP